MTEERVIVALFNAAWQSTALALAVALGLRMVQRTSASVRCAIWTGALLLAIALPVIDYAAAPSVPLPQTSTVKHAAAIVPPSLPALRPAHEAAALRSIPTGAVHWVAPASIRSEPAPAAKPHISLPAVRLSLATILQSIAQNAFLLWCAGMTLFGLRFAYQVGCLLAAKREIEPVNHLALTWGSRTRRAVRIGLSDRIAVPCLLGMFKPVIALPRALACELSDADLQRVVLHEAAHLQRGDDWFNLVEQLALVILFFNPAIHVIARRIEIEREIACDDLVIATMQNRITYAQFLTGLARRTSSRTAVMVPGFFTNRRQIFVRIEQLLDRRHNGSSIIGRRAVLALGLLSMAAVALAQVDIPVLAAARTVPAKPPIAARQPVLAVIRAALPATVKPVRTVRVASAPVAGKRAVAPSTKVKKALKVMDVHRTIRLSLREAPSGNIRRLEHEPSLKQLSDRMAALAQARVLVAVASVSRLPAIRKSVPLAGRAQAVASTAIAVATVVQADSAAQIAQAAAPRADAIEAANTDSLLGYNGYAVDDVVELHDNGVTPSFILDMKRAGYSQLSASQLIQLRTHGVSAAFARAITGGGKSTIDINTLIHLCDHGISASYANALATSGLTGLSADNLIALRDNGVSAEYVAGLARAGFKALPTADIVRLYDNGVTAAYIQRVRHDLNSTHLTIDQLIRLRNSGI